MKRSLSVNLGNLLLSLSDAMDLANPNLVQHQQRTAFIAWEMAMQAGLPPGMQEDLFVAALLHDIGALSLEEKVKLHNWEVQDPNPHCIRGEILLKNIPWLRNSASIVRFHHREWREWRECGESLENPLVMEAQLLTLADYLERLIAREKYILHQHGEIKERVLEGDTELFHPRLTELFAETSVREEFWLDLVSPRLYSLLLNNGPYRQLEIEIGEVALLSELFKNVIDFKSRFTATHSSGVAACAEIMARLFGLTDVEIKLMGVAGNLHDLGKLAIPNSILEKPAGLTAEEFAVMKSHTYYTYWIINTIGDLQQIAEWAAYHHEKLDGSGYPFHCRAGELDTGARILMTADIFTALAEDRPYRPGKSKNEITAILKNFHDRHLLDCRIIELLFDNYKEIFSYVRDKQRLAFEFYEKQFSPYDLKPLTKSS